MDRKEKDTLTVAEAKERVREAARRLSLAEWVRENPADALATSFVAGFSAGKGKNGGDSEKLLLALANLLK